MGAWVGLRVGEVWFEFEDPGVGVGVGPGSGCGVGAALGTGVGLKVGLYVPGLNVGAEVGAEVGTGVGNTFRPFVFVMNCFRLKGRYYRLFDLISTLSCSLRTQLRDQSPAGKAVPCMETVLIRPVFVKIFARRFGTKAPRPPQAGDSPGAGETTTDNPPPTTTPHVCQGCCCCYTLSSPLGNIAGKQERTII